MTIEKEEYPKEIITYEKITEDSDDTTKVVTIVDNKFEEKAVKVAIAWMNAFNKRDLARCDNAINFPLIRLGMKGLIIFKKPRCFHLNFLIDFQKLWDGIALAGNIEM